MKKFQNNKILKIATVIILICFCSMIPAACIISNINTPKEVSGLIVHYIDVGQGDCILIQSSTKNMIIDSGPSESYNSLNKYLKQLHIKKIDYLIATHPHEDHIGNMDKLIDDYDVKCFLAPKVLSNTSYFNDMIKALRKKHMVIHTLNNKSKYNIDLGNDITTDVIAPINTSYDKTNNYSVVLRIQYRNTSFLFTGDAEKESEDEILQSNTDINSDVLKVGHHGSSTSTSEEFLNKVNPKIAVISVGLNNTYNHPSNTTISKLINHKCKIYRTDKDGSISLQSDGNNIKRIAN